MLQQSRVAVAARSEEEEVVTVVLCCRYRAALDAAVATEQVEVVANLLEELAARSGLSAALGEPFGSGKTLHITLSAPVGQIGNMDKYRCLSGRFLHDIKEQVVRRGAVWLQAAGTRRGCCRC